jgi:hypothetical protein
MLRSRSESTQICSWRPKCLQEPRESQETSAEDLATTYKNLAKEYDEEFGTATLKTEYELVKKYDDDEAMEGFDDFIDGKSCQCPGEHRS